LVGPALEVSSWALNVRRNGAHVATSPLPQRRARSGEAILATDYAALEGLDDDP